ncbi:BON domain-containing protein [Paraburkholderia silvatlantica]|uniref:Osmotically-inducible protein OsmY n=1 Tax=Paraburkholderia silvatlantica TaxID=321895 RepID=A0ABR6FK23_9BURK|nr:BON domain-containing protein [Paraburkholderia silvatlantica]MBB2927467.1 osmotically-inducible protein OsmY [Paraburkholderia silvatlantica]PVY36180.1 BON domain-containing protein [Paraburkholderia silvatlantica]PXW40404.1 BON domain-containing protein [Paraburkholderia silvatlantica]
MKAIQVFKLAAATALVAASLHAYAQGDATAAAQQQASPTQAQSKQAKAANRALSHKIRSALAKDKKIDIAKITVRVRDGAVVLQGSVPEQSQIEHATEVAKGVQGVTSVKNALTIRPNES